jgi:hypothetical protein
LTGEDRTMTIVQGKMSDENIEKLMNAYKHPFERVPEKFYAEHRV